MWVCLTALSPTLASWDWKNDSHCKWAKHQTNKQKIPNRSFWRFGIFLDYFWTISGVPLLGLSLPSEVSAIFTPAPNATSLGITAFVLGFCLDPLLKWTKKQTSNVYAFSKQLRRLAHILLKLSSKRKVQRREERRMGDRYAMYEF